MGSILIDFPQWIIPKRLNLKFSDNRLIMCRRKAATLYK